MSEVSQLSARARGVSANLYPLAFALVGVITLFVAAGEPLVVLPRVTLLVALVIISIQVVSSLALRSASRGALATLVLILLIAGLWPAALALGALPIWWVTIALLHRLRAQPEPSREPLRLGQRLLNVFALTLLAVVCATGALSGAFPAYGAIAASVSDARLGMPNVYLVLLDGYPGSGSASDAYHVDNTRFANALEARGFTVPARARSNYTLTWATLASMFQMRYLDDEPGLTPAPADLGEQRRRLARLINGGRALVELRRLGYRLVSVPSAFTSAALLGADEVIDPTLLNEFEELVLRKSGILGLAGDAGRDWVASQARQRIESGIDALGQWEPNSDGRPTFFFDHVLAPHPPFLFKADGSPANVSTCYPTDCPFWVTELPAAAADERSYTSALVEELAYLDARVLASIDALIARDPDAVVIVFGDHGLRVGEDISEYFETFFAARTPGRPGSFGESVALVNVFPTLLNAYAGTEFPLRPYRAWHSSRLPLDLTPMPIEP